MIDNQFTGRGKVKRTRIPVKIYTEVKITFGLDPDDYYGDIEWCKGTPYTVIVI